jgi:DNA (cytosine-5)-methyltransferase 1
VEWAHAVKPSLILLENVEEFREWGPLDEDNQPIKALKGTTFDTWVRQIRRCGYRVEWRELRACDYGAPTTRKRLFLIAKRDCEPIIWPNPTHGAPGDKKVLSGVLKPWRTAAECLDFSLPCPSVFMSREEARAYQKHTGIRVKRPLAEKTMARIAKGIKRFVLDVADPFILNLTHGGRVESLGEPLRTVTSAHRGEKALVAPHLLRHFGQSTGNATTSPVGTITAGGGGKIGLITSHMVKFRGSNIGHDLREPAHTISAGGMHAAEARAFLIKYYGQGTGSDLREPTPTVTALDRFGLVMIHGEPYRIVDVGMRMLQPRELFRAQGFADDYVIERGSDGKKLSKTTQVSLCGNSVCPPIAAALVTANMGHFSVDQAVA